MPTWPCGPSPSWWGRSASANGPPTVGCAIPRGAACATTRSPYRCVVSPDGERVTVSVGDHELELSSLERPIFPTGFTKRDMLDYYARVAPAMLRHLHDRPVTVKRFPQGVDHQGFIE